MRTDGISTTYTSIALQLSTEHSLQNSYKLTATMQGSTILGAVSTPVRYSEMNFFVTSLPVWFVQVSLVSGSISTPRSEE